MIFLFYLQVTPTDDSIPQHSQGAACRASFPSVFATATEMECSDEPWTSLAANVGKHRGRSGPTFRGRPSYTWLFTRVVTTKWDVHPRDQTAFQNYKVG